MLLPLTYLTSLTDVFGQICRQPASGLNRGGGGNHFTVDKESVSQAAVTAATAAATAATATAAAATAATTAAAAGVTDKYAVRSVAR